MFGLLNHIMQAPIVNYPPFNAFLKATFLFLFILFIIYICTIRPYPVLPHTSLKTRKEKQKRINFCCCNCSTKKKYILLLG